MKNVLEYKGYFAKIEYSVEDGILFGKIEGIKDLVTFECDDLSCVEKEFHTAVDDYIAFCADIGKEPNKTYSGVFNVRISPELHRAAAMAADREGVKLNSFVKSAIQDKVEGKTKTEVYYLTKPQLSGYEFATGMRAESRVRGVPYGSKS